MFIKTVARLLFGDAEEQGRVPDRLSQLALTKRNRTRFEPKEDGKRDLVARYQRYFPLSSRCPDTFDWLRLGTLAGFREMTCPEEPDQEPSRRPPFGIAGTPQQSHDVGANADFVAEIGSSC